MNVLPAGQSAADASVVELPRERAASRARGLLQAILDGSAAGAKADARASTLELFLRAKSPAEALRLWTAEELTRETAPDISSQLSRDIASVDQLLADQVNQLLHHPRLQRLEASWRGLAHLVQQASDARESMHSERQDSDIKIRVLSLTKRELARDLENAVDFDQSQLFKRVYSDGFGILGGEPLGVLIGDYQFAHQIDREHRVDDVATLRRVSEVAAAAFCPFISAAAPELFALDEFRLFEQPIELAPVFRQPEYIKWQSFRESDDAQFIGLTAPRVLMRLPYEDDGGRRDGFRFEERVGDPSGDNYLWGNAAFAFGGVLVRAFGASRWFAEIRGLSRPAVAGGEVVGMDADWSRPEARHLVPKSLTEVAIDEERQRELAELGIIPLCAMPHSPRAVFYTNASAHKPKKYVDPVATANAKLSAMLQYVMCAARFAHYLKVIARNKLGNVADAQQLEDLLNEWLSRYVTSDALAPAETKARFPLREKQLRVEEQPGRPGHFRMVMHLLPHYQLDDLKASLRLTTSIGPGSE
ncbi:MAG: type VI secretion system contractile sheath large subunit [Planctomycetia bacterium]|nr:type VI secretion system contractile sheath large subunit [Planctomycetia bacterium]